MNDATPRLSVMLPVYRPTEHLLEALQSARRALDEAGVRAQVEVVDDASPDLDVEALIATWVAAGRIDAVVVHRRPQNGGLGRCWNTCIERARGDYVHILHQDDLVRPGFYARILAEAERLPEAGMIFCRTVFLEGERERLDVVEQTEAGLLDGWLERICAGQRLQCPSVVVKRAVYKRLGGYEPGLRYVIDWEMWIRIAAFEVVAYLPEALAVYRIHAEAESGKIKSAGLATRDAASGLRRIKRTLTEAGRLDCYPRAVEFGISISGFAAYDAERAHRWDIAAKELMIGLRCFGRSMRLPSLYRQIRGYARARLKSVEQHAFVRH